MRQGMTNEAGVDCLHFVVPPGIGDISWVYSKLVNLGRPLHFIVPDGHPRRALPYLRILPAIVYAAYGSIDTKDVLRRGHLAGRSAVTIIEESRKSPVYVQLNTHLENGLRIEDYVPELEVKHHYEMRFSEVDVRTAEELIAPWDRFLTIHCANTRTAKMWKGWQEAEWAEFAHLMLGAYDLDGAVIIGADWDREMAARVTGRIGGRLPVRDLTGKLPLAASLHVIRSGVYMVSFPSGMPILAAVMDCPVMMFYPDHLKPMQLAWADPEMIENGRYKGCQFCEPFRAYEWVRDNCGDLG